MSRVTLAQWQMLAAVVDHGGFARAAEQVHRSPSTLNHAVHKLEQQLGVAVLEPHGRQVRLTDAGELLLRRARQLLDSADALEGVAANLAGGLETEVRLAIDQIVPESLQANALKKFSGQYPLVRVQLHESVLQGGVDSLAEGGTDILVSALDVEGFSSEPLLKVALTAVAHPDHPLHRLGRPLDLGDLARYRQLVVRDTAQRQPVDAGWLKAEQRWTVSHLQTSLDMVRRGLGFAWLPASRIAEALACDALRALPLVAGGVRWVSLHLIVRDHEQAGPATQAMAAALRDAAAMPKDRIS